MPLTDVVIRNAKPRGKPVKLFDERGLYLEVSSGGGKWWRLTYRVDGEEKRRADCAENSFEVIAGEWSAINSTAWARDLP